MKRQSPHLRPHGLLLKDKIGQSLKAVKSNCFNISISFGWFYTSEIVLILCSCMSIANNIHFGL